MSTDGPKKDLHAPSAYRTSSSGALRDLRPCGLSYSLPVSGACSLMVMDPYLTTMVPQPCHSFA